MTSKQYKGKDCAYCGKPKSSSTEDHVVAREFFFEEERANLPKVPSCKKCNNHKSKLEHYASAALMTGTNHPKADIYRQSKVRPRLQKNLKLQRDIGIYNPPVWMNVNGVIQQMHVIKIDTKKIKELMAMIVKGLYFFHYKYPLDSRFYVDISMYAPDVEIELVGKLSSLLTPGSSGVRDVLGHGSFMYEGVQSSRHEGFTAWRMIWHGGIPLYGGNSPPQGVSVFWGLTRLTPEASAALGGEEGG